VSHQRHLGARIPERYAGLSNRCSYPLCHQLDRLLVSQVRGCGYHLRAVLIQCNGVPLGLVTQAGCGISFQM
jgi:hypothetical protein